MIRNCCQRDNRLLYGENTEVSHQGWNRPYQTSIQTGREIYGLGIGAFNLFNYFCNATLQKPRNPTAEWGKIYFLSARNYSFGCERYGTYLLTRFSARMTNIFCWPAGVSSGLLQRFLTSINGWLSLQQIFFSYFQIF